MSEQIRPEKHAKYANVILDSPSRQLDRPFTYEVPFEMEESVSVGSMVVVPFLNSMHSGFVIEFSEPPDLPKIRAIAQVVDEPPAFNEDMVELCRWMSGYYVSTLAQALRLVLPPGRSRQVVEMVELLEDPDSALEKTGPARARERLIIERLAANGNQLPLRQLKSDLGPWVSGSLKNIETRRSAIRRFVLAEPRASSLKVRMLEISEAGKQALSEDALRRAPARRRLLEALSARGKMSAAELRELEAASNATIRAAINAGLILESRYETARDIFHNRSFPKEEPHRLNDEQQMALEGITGALRSGGEARFLLHGVTGSGKTEVYLQAIDKVLEAGRGCIVLVPEIALTPQMVQRFKSRLGKDVAVLHSGLGLGERYDQWRGIREGRHRVVIGARSAVFAPVSDLGLLIIDEEHETTYKEGSAPRYNAGRVAQELARLKKALVIYGSATPSIESRFLADRGDLTYLRLPRRIDDRPLPRAEAVDMRELADSGYPVLISPRLANALAGIFKTGEQAILFLNRRGFARFLQCHGCGHIFQCPNCSVSLCYHSREGYLLCHHCDWRALPPFTCPECQRKEHRYTGAGTERVEAELKRLLPDLETIRMDADTTRRKDSHWDILDHFRAGKAQVLLGTQMIAKGLDIPNVTLVGIISADTSLGLPDFRAGERTFQLLTQVSGRAGRGSRHGAVIVQTYNPDHYAIRAALAGDEAAFYRQEIELRREAGYPPFCSLTNLVITASNEGDCISVSEWLGDFLREKLKAEKLAQVLGPAPAPLSRLKGRYRYHVTVKSSSPRSLGGLDDCLSAYESFRASYCRRRGLAKEDISLIVDVDPVNML